MFDTLFIRPHALARYYSAPCPESRANYLSYCKAQGYPRSSLEKIAWVLLVFSQSFDLCKPGKITREEIEFAVDHRIRFRRRKEPIEESKSSRLLFISTVVAWLRFLGYFEELPRKPSVFSDYVESFAQFMRDERGLSPATITFRQDEVLRFLSSISGSKHSLDSILINDVDSYLASKGRNGWSRRSLRTLADALRSFFRYAHAKGLVGDIAEAIEAPPLYAQEGLPFGPTWEQVQQLITSISGDTITDLRDRAIVLLFAVYGLRASEVSRLQLSDIDWERDILHIARPKQRCYQQYPLNTEVGNAIARYLKEARPASKHRSLFLTICAPFRPLSAASMTPLVHSRLVALGIELPLRPYIFSNAELKSLLDAVPASCSQYVKIDPIVIRTLILLLYGACLRIGEALRLTISDVNLQQNTLFIHKTKFYKSRLIPLGKDLEKALLSYIKNRNVNYSNGTDDPLFCFQDGSALSHSAAQSAFCRLRALTGIHRDDAGRYQPRLHDLRHTGAVHRVIAWYRNGSDLKYLLPQLATYLGHINLSATQRYLSLTPELLHEANQRFIRYVEATDHD